MTAKNLQNLKSYLEETGFVQKSEYFFAWNQEQAKVVHRKQFPWQIIGWNIENHEQSLKQIDFEAQLKRDCLLQNCEELLRERFPSFRSGAIHTDHQAGFWLLFEFLDPELDADQSRLIEEEELQSGQLPHGLAGLHITMIQVMGQLSVFMTKHFTLGNVPGQLLLEFPKMLTGALFGDALKKVANFNAYISTISVEDIRQTLIQHLQLPDMVKHSIRGDLAVSSRPFLQENLVVKEDSWTLQWSQKESLQELVVPPIEVIEQKEVARRFQKLDELILLEDFSGAIAQCREYLQQFPQSLYLIRRWSFLSLWGELSFDKKYLDLVTKFDPISLMTLSLWIRSSMQTYASDALLENLSKLGNSLGQMILGFGQIDITSLTLPEMLGDAWNQIGDQRAVACYERVLQTRGEIPRILVKLIRLMRDVDNEAAEESYMDRLLACEVPTRTRAAIYYRLAEIKQMEDRQEAVQWALKSWQTNRKQVKYAILAADLLIALDRSHEAVHVLVETCEFIDANETFALKLELELKIASIWLHQLHRSDLAIERLDRARDLVGNDSANLDLLLPLAQSLGDAGIYADLLIQALENARHSNDSDRVESLVEALLNLADGMENLKQLSRIYSLILSSTLIEVKDIEAILQIPHLELPYTEILVATERLLQSIEPEKCLPYLLLMGDIARVFLQDAGRARKHYERAMEFGQLSEKAFDFLDEHYAKLGINRQRFELLKHRQMDAPIEDQKLILRELYYFDDGIAEEEKDQIAIDIFRLDNEDMGPLEERLASYEVQGSAQGIYHLVEQAIERANRLDSMAPLLRSAWQSLQATASIHRFRYIDHIFQYLHNIELNPVQNAHAAIDCLWVDPDKGYVKFYLEIILASGEVPNLDPKQMLDALDDSEIKIDLLIRLAGSAKEPVQAINYERQAFQIVRNMAGFLPLKMLIVQSLAEKCPLLDDELNEYAKAVRQSGKNQGLFKLIASQIPLIEADSTREKLFQLSKEYIGRTVASNEDMQLMQDSISELPIEQQLVLKTIWLERIGFSEKIHSKEFSIQMLQDKLFWSNHEAVRALLKQMTEIWQEAALARTTIMTVLQSMIEDDREQDLKFYLDLLLPTDLLSQASSLAAFEYFAIRRDSDFMERSWLHCLRIQENAEQTRRLLDYSLDLLKEHGMVAFLYEIIATLVNGSESTKFLNIVQREILIFLADFYYISEAEKRRSMRLYEQVYAEDNSDKRVWGPLIDLYQHFGADVDLFELLHRIVPRLRKDAEPLLRYNLKLDALERKFIDIGERLGLKTDFIAIDSSYVPSSDLQFSASTLLNNSVGPSGTSLQPGSGQLNLPTMVLPTLIIEAPLDTQIPVEFPPLEGDTKTAIDAVLPPQGSPILRPEEFSFSKYVYSPNTLPMHTNVAEPSGLPVPELMRQEKLVVPSSSAQSQATLTPKLPAPPNLPVVAFDVKLPLNLIGTNFDDNLDLGTAVAARVDKQEAIEFDYVSTSESLSRGAETLASSNVSTYLSEPDSATKVEKNRKQNFEFDDWRIVANQAKPKPGLCQWLLSHPLPDKIENHLALQVAAVFEEKVQLLESWPHKVWRRPADYFYELNWASRMVKDAFHPGIKSPLAKLLKALHPIIIHHFSNQMNLKAMAVRLKVQPNEIVSFRKAFDWKDEVIQRCGLRFYGKFLVENKYQIFHLPKFEDRIQFDFERREIYIDREYFLQRPPSHLFHKLAFLIRAVNIEYYPFLNLSPSNELFPFLMKCRRALEQNKMDDVKRIFGMEKDELKLMLSQSDREYIEKLFSEVGPLSPDKITKIVGVYVDQIYRLNLAESLDLIGLIEAIGNADLLLYKASTQALVHQTAAIRSVIAFSADLKFVS